MVSSLVWKKVDFRVNKCQGFVQARFLMASSTEIACSLMTIVGWLGIYYLVVIFVLIGWEHSVLL